ncbi:hypothetical protein B7C42_00250 [Nocardia cerradoensis]|uniref:Metallo-beta-lactamase domain-containing protein n=1 Tax=Nocardia cerradoensis TaxID=85688 RepID=A0A231HEC8_9NOCA|nr:hypothetical protein [Nocardia cerradoensis]OXR47128.1 hypothetical protein B7C42_00250 [Nocardia cerradoensis]
MASPEALPARGAVFWPVGTGDSTTLVVDESTVLQIDLHDLAKAQDEENPEVAVVDRLVDALPTQDGKPYLATFALTHADKDHCLGFADLLSKVQIGELWSTPRLWREFNDPDAPEPCPDAVAFREESERRIEATMAAIAKGGQPASGDRIKVVGYDDEHSKQAYDELPDEYKSWPGKSITKLDGRDYSDRFEAFIHAPFREDCAAPRNETSLAMQVTLTDDTGTTGKLLLFGDLAHDTIMKIFEYSEHHDRANYLEWDLLLAPHHCSKKVMYKPNDSGNDELQLDIMDAFERHRLESGVVIFSSGIVPSSDTPGANPPHRKAADRYAEISDETICTMSWGDEKAPSPIILGIDATGARIVREIDISAASRLAAVTAAATSLASALPSLAPETEDTTDPIEDAVISDRGGERAPDQAVGFGQ